MHVFWWLLASCILGGPSATSPGAPCFSLGWEALCGGFRSIFLLGLPPPGGAHLPVAPRERPCESFHVGEPACGRMADCPPALFVAGRVPPGCLWGPGGGAGLCRSLWGCCHRPASDSRCFADSMFPLGKPGSSLWPLSSDIPPGSGSVFLHCARRVLVVKLTFCNSGKFS